MVRFVGSAGPIDPLLAMDTVNHLVLMFMASCSSSTSSSSSNGGGNGGGGGSLTPLQEWMTDTELRRRDYHHIEVLYHDELGTSGSGRYGTGGLGRRAQVSI